MLDECRTKDIIILADRLLQGEGITSEQESELHAAKAWAFFRQKDYENAKREGKLAGKKNTFAQECLDAIAGILGEEEKVEKYHTCLLGSILADNAWIVAARQEGSTITHEEVLIRADKWLGNGIIADSTYTANVANNTARFFLTKSRRKEDLEVALKYMKKAVELYGEGDVNLHHRASAHFWLSNIAEKMEDKKSAIVFVKKSIILWKRQLELDAENLSFVDAFNKTQKRLKDLES